MRIAFQGKTPQIEEDVFIAQGAKLIGDLSAGSGCSFWYNAVMRADLAPIRIGNRVNIQDGVVGHVNTNQPLLVADDVSVGHGAIIHGCRIGKGTLIGMGAIILNGADIGEYALIGAGTVVLENSQIPPYTLAVGSPARVVRELNDEDLARMKTTTESYVQKARQFRNESD
ncbi:gamma carbonic anhydrase family protein [Marinicrinis sediminis]|uniref:Gamma carbonic anhydrase family protein n=1 Tax=Marinicrinis sediminis TaxID=1652465 RepID=A0ABW5REU3_9BACL